MTKCYVVVDQNILRKKLILEEYITTQINSRFVLPDLAFLEMTQNEQWESTLRYSLEILSNHPNRVYVCRSVNEALERELKQMKPITNHMMDVVATNFVRDILKSVCTGTDGYAIARIRSDLDNHRAALVKDHLDHHDNKESFRALIEATKDTLPFELQKRMRANKVSREERLQVIYELSTSLFLQILGDRGLSREKLRAFMKRKPLILRYLYLKVWHCIAWIQKGGFESFLAKNVSNDLMDHHYVLSATFFHDFLSEDAVAKESYQDMLVLLARKV